MTTAALIIAVVALLAAFLAIRQASSLRERLDRATDSLLELRSAANQANEAVQEQLADLRLGLRRQAGEAIFKPEMTIAEAMAVHPKVSDVLADFHLGGCSQCAVSDVDTIQGACQTYGIDQKGLMAALNGLIGGGTAGPTKTPNVKLNF